MSSEASPYGDPHPQSSFGATDHSQGPARKKMRKGTKSCIECRRRKIKCTFEPGRTQICNECFARGSTCVDQEHGDVNTFVPNPSSETSSLRDRVSNLEDLVRQVLHRLPEKGALENVTGEADHIDTQAGKYFPKHFQSLSDQSEAEVLKSLRSPSKAAKPSVDESIYFPSTNSRDSVPALSLFDNEVLATKEVEPTVSREQYNKAKTVIGVLLNLLLPISDLEVILEASQEWWTIWKAMFPDLTDRRCHTVKEAVSHTLRSEKPAEVGKIMLCIALSIHQIPLDFDWNRISVKESPSEIMERYVTTVDRLIVQDEEIAATIDGIECMVLMSKWHINMGRPRKSWLLFRRAIAFAQLLGLHRLAQRKPTGDETQYSRQLMLWCHLIMGDRYISLILGLPYTVNESFCKPALALAKSRCKPGSGELYLCEIVPLITKIIDRNQNATGTPYTVTMAMEEEMEELRNKQDPGWWTHERLPGTTLEEHFERLQAQFYHHHGRILLHMPFMMKSSSDKRYQFSHTATLESARDMIKYYDALRGSESVSPHACKVVDFQAFTAAMLLLLNLCGYAQATRSAVPQQPDLDQDQQDSALIDRTIHLLKGAAAEAGGLVAANSAQALELLAKVREGCDGPECPDSCQVSIPYFGTITITIGKRFVPIKRGTYPDAGMSVAKQQQQQQQQQYYHKQQRLPSQTSLPTPPSMTSHSTQQSPRESLMSANESSARPSPYWNPSSMEQSWKNAPDADPFVTFDSFMAFPSGQIDFSTMDGGGSGFAGVNGPLSAGSSDYLIPNQPPPFAGTLDEQGMAQGFPFPVVGSNVDLDAGWNWFGVGAPSL